MMKKLKSVVASRKVQVFLIVAVLLVGLRLGAAFVLESYLNQTLDELQGYQGQVDEVDLKLWRGAAEGMALEVSKSGRRNQVPFVSAEKITVGIQPEPLLSGELVDEVIADGLVLNFVGGSGGDGAGPVQLQAPSNWVEVSRKLTPFTTNRIVINDGEVHFRNFQSEPPINIYLHDISIEATNLANARGVEETLPATIVGDASVMTSGRLHLEMEVDPAARQPSFDIDLSIRGLDVTDLNDLLRHYASFDAEAGELGVDLELRARNGSVEGFIRPQTEGLAVSDIGGSDHGLGALWEGALDLGFDLLEDESSERASVRIPLGGEVQGRGGRLLNLVGSLVLGAMVQTLERILGGAVELNASIRPEGRRHHHRRTIVRSDGRRLKRPVHPDERRGPLKKTGEAS